MEHLIWPLLLFFMAFMIIRTFIRLCKTDEKHTEKNLVKRGKSRSERIVDEYEDEYDAEYEEMLRQDKLEEEREEQAWKNEEFEEEIKYILQRKPTGAEQSNLKAFFGGEWSCIKNINALNCHIKNGGKAFRVSPAEHNFNSLLFLFQVGIVSRGLSVPLGKRMEVLSMEQIRQIADSLGVKRAQGKLASIDRIMSVEAGKIESVWPTAVPVEEIFYIDATAANEKVLRAAQD